MALWDLNNAQPTGYGSVGGRVYEIYSLGPLTGSYGDVTQVRFIDPASSGGQSTVTGVNPVETSYSLYGHTIPLSAFGLGRIGGEIISGPWTANGLASFIISFGFPADPAGTRHIKEIAFDSEVVWTEAGGFTSEAFTYRFYGGTLTQAADALESTHFGVDAVAYRPQMLLAFENLPLANTKFKKIPYVSALISDDTGDAVNVGEALERIAYSPFVGWTSDQFETTGVTDGVTSGGLILTQQTDFLSLVQQFARFYPQWDVLQTDKLRIIDRGSNVTPDITLDKTTLLGKISYSRQEPNSAPLQIELTTIDPDADYTLVPSLAQHPTVPALVSSSVTKDAAYLPVIMDASTRQSLVTYALYHEEQARKKIGFTAMMFGLEIEPGDLVSMTGLGNDFHDEVFKVKETLHGANYSVEVTAESILKCTVAGSFSPTTPGAAASWAVSRSRILVPGYAGPLDSVSSGKVQTLYDQTGNARNISASSSSSRPTATTSGPNSRECCNFAPTSGSVGHTLIGSVSDPVSEIMSSSTGYMVVSIRPDVITQNSASAHLNAGVLNWGPFYANGGLSVRNGGVLYAYNNDGSGSVSALGGTPDTAASASSAVPVGGLPCVIEWRHEGGVLYQRVNGANETSVSSGANTDMTRPLKMGYGGVTGTFFDGKIFEAMAYSTVPTLSERNAIVADMMSWVGA